MGVQINMPKGGHETSMGRRLFSIAAPIVGGIYGGPVGAAAGSMLASKVNGESTQGSILGGLQTGASAQASPSAQLSAPTQSAAAQPTDFSLGAYERKIGALKQDPAAGINEGIDVLSHLPNEHPLRKELAAPLLRAQMLSQQNRYGGA